MSFPPDRLAALAAVVDEGTFDAAARALRVTPSAVSQRIRALESQVGRVLVERATPCVATEAGDVLVRLARQQRLLDEEANAELTPDDAARARLAVAVNADSLATWLPAVFAQAATWDDVTLEVAVDDESHSAGWLRRGHVLGAVTAEPVAMQGCRVVPLGAMRYLPVATPEFVARWRARSGRGLDWAAAPLVRFGPKDVLQERVLDAVGVVARPPAQIVPSSEGFVAAVRAGLGWGAVPRLQLGDDLDAGRLVLLDRRAHLDVPLSWQHWRLASPRLERLTATIERCAREALGAP